MAERAGLRLQVLEKRQIERERMAGLLAVNSGSVRPPLFLIAEHAPPAARGTAVLVGKGITFDSGGDLHQAGGRDGGDEVRHDGSGHGPRRASASRGR